MNGQNHTSTEISADGLVIFRQELQNFHEEADEIIVAHVIYAATVESKHVQVVADDTDIYTSCFCIIITQIPLKPR